jgi:hypothetical protein
MKPPALFSTARPTTTTTPRALATGSAESKIAALWGEAWARLAVERPNDLEERLASLPPAVLSLEASAARWSARVLKGEADAIEVEAKIAEWADAVLAALAAQDHARSERLCLDCGAGDVPTVAPGLTGSRVCARCLRESKPAFPRLDEGKAHHGSERRKWN